MWIKLATHQLLSALCIMSCRSIFASTLAKKWFFQDFRHVHRPTSRLSGASHESLTGQSAGSMNTVTDSGVSERTSNILASSEQLSSRSDDDEDHDDDADKRENNSDYNDDR